MPNPKKTIKVLAVFFVLFAGFVINSCRRDIQPVPNTDLPPEIALAKSWYESTYTTNSTSNQHLTTQSTGTGTPNTAFDFSRHIRPDWSHPSAYKRFGKNVIEMPIDPSSAKIGASLGNMPGGKAVYQNKYSRSSFLLLNDGSGYSAYIMTVIADSSYLKNNLKKLGDDKYNKRDSDFSGVVLYSTPQGSFVSGWFYKNGKIISAMSAMEKKYTPATGSSTNRLKTDELEAVEYCQDWYQTVSVNGVVYSVTYLGSTCTTEYIDVGGGGVSDGGTSGSSGGTSGGGGGSAPVQPTNPCSVVNPASVNTGHLVIDVVAPLPGGSGSGDNGGFPAPTSDPCSTITSVTVTPVDTIQMTFCESLTTAEKASITSTLDAFKNEDCASEFLYDYFAGKTFGFCIQSGPYNVIFDPQSNSFIFSTDAAATPVFASLLEHEFFHAFQNATYSGGISIYGQNSTTHVNSPGFVNIEFEQAVFNDIVNHSSNAFINGTFAQRQSYQNWLNNLTGNGTVYPKLSSSSPGYTDFINNYNSFLQQYNAIPGNVNSSQILNLTPNAFIKFFNSTNPNCQ